MFHDLMMLKYLNIFRLLILVLEYFFFFFSSRRRHTRCSRDWSSDVCSSDLNLLKPAMDRIDAQMASGGGVIGIPSGFHDLDRMTNGFKAADLAIIAGRPSMEIGRASCRERGVDLGGRRIIKKKKREKVKGAC